MKKLLYHILKIANILVALSLIFAYLGTWISPSIFWPFAFFGLIFPYLLILNFLFLLLWLIKWKKIAFISLITILIGFQQIYHSAPVFKIKSELNNKKGKDLKILSYNVRAFNLYAWMNDPNTDKGILNFIRSEHPDIICLQEFHFRNNSDSNSKKVLAFFKDTPYRHIQYIDENANSGFGIATFSRYPIIKRGNLKFKNSNNLSIYTDILFHEDTIRVFNSHLQSVNFRQNNYHFIETGGKDHPEKNMKEIRDISSKLKTAYIKRANQTQKISALISKSLYPLIVCGDFNDTPVSYTYRKLSKNLSDAFLVAGKGRGNTYLGRIPIRIDYIFYGKEFEATQFEKVEANLSDHYPIISILRK